MTQKGYLNEYRLRRRDKKPTTVCTLGKRIQTHLKQDIDDRKKTDLRRLQGIHKQAL